MTIQKKLLVLYVNDFMPVDENTRIVLFHVFSGVPD